MLRACLGAVAVCLVCLQQGGAVRAVAASQDRSGGPATATAGQLIISEFRVRGSNGLNDEFIEIYNASGADHTVAALSGSGYGVAASDGITRCSIPNGTIIPNGGHYLCVNSVGYSLASYPAGSGATATGDTTYTTDIPDNAGIAIFNNNSGGGSYSLANRLDAVGSTSEANATYKEGSGYPALIAFSIEYAWTRRPAGGCTGSSSGNCNSALLVETTPGVASVVPVDTNDNASDFIFVDTNGTSAGGGQRLGAPGPENLSGPMSLAGSPTVKSTKLDSCAPTLTPPNKIRDFTSDPPNNSTFGTYDIRRTWTNTSGVSLTRLRFRIVDVSTFPSISGVADFRPRTSPDVTVTVDRSPCGTGVSNVVVRGTTLEQPPSQPNGSGYNGSLSVGAVSLGTPLANAASIDVRFLLGLQQTGVGRFCVVPETVPATAGEPFCFIGNSDGNIVPAPGDFDYDQIADMPLYDMATGQWKILKSGGGTYTASLIISWGGAGYVPVPGDYDGDGRFDAAVYQESTGLWLVLTSSSNYTRAFSVSWGGYGYVAVPGDYDRDGRTDIAIYNAATGFWYVLRSNSAYTSSMTINWGGPGYTPVGGQDFDGDKRADLVIYQPTTANLFVLKSGANYTTTLTLHGGGPGWMLVPGDYDGDGLADFGIYSPGSGTWEVLTSSTSYNPASMILKGWGGPGYLPVTGDFDADGRADLGLYQPSTGKWFISKSTSGYVTDLQATFGAVSDVPFSAVVKPVASRDVHAGDFDGDFRNDMTVYNSTTGVWSTLTSNTNFAGASSIAWGGPGYSAVPGDYDGDGKGDLGLYQPSTGNWYILLSSTGFTTSLSKSAGGPGWQPVPGDYDGDGKADLMVYNTTTGLWYGLKSSSSYVTAISVSLGGTGYTATPGDFDGDGRLDLAVYQSSSGNWSVKTSSSSYTIVLSRNWGGAGFVPVQADFDGDGITDFAVYQTSTGLWTALKSSALNLTTISMSYGGAGYTPLAGDWDGDHRADIGVYDTAGNWLILLSSGNYSTLLTKNWGGAGYSPLPVYP